MKTSTRRETGEWHWNTFTPFLYLVLFCQQCLVFLQLFCTCMGSCGASSSAGCVVHVAVQLAWVKVIISLDHFLTYWKAFFDNFWYGTWAVLSPCMWHVGMWISYVTAAEHGCLVYVEEVAWDFVNSVESVALYWHAQRMSCVVR